MVIAFIGVFAMFLGIVLMMNASPPDSTAPGFVVFCCGAVLTAAAFVEVIARAVF